LGFLSNVARPVVGGGDAGPGPAIDSEDGWASGELVEIVVEQFEEGGFSNGRSAADEENAVLEYAAVEVVDRSFAWADGG